MKKLYLIALLLTGSAYAQGITTTHHPVTITTAGTFQPLLCPNGGTNTSGACSVGVTQRQAITIANPNADTLWVYIGTGTSELTCASAVVGNASGGNSLPIYPNANPLSITPNVPNGIICITSSTTNGDFVDGITNP